MLELYGTPTLLMHGDLLCTDDRRYQAFRRVVRNRLCNASHCCSRWRGARRWSEARGA